MTLDLPRDLEEWINAEVRRGHFASADEAIIEAVRRLSRERRGRPAPAKAGADVRRAIEELKEFSRGNTLGEGLTIREMIEEGRR